jgi:hypothetical protein
MQALGIGIRAKRVHAGTVSGKPSKEGSCRHCEWEAKQRGFMQALGIGGHKGNRFHTSTGNGRPTERGLRQALEMGDQGREG